MIVIKCVYCFQSWWTGVIAKMGIPVWETQAFAACGYITIYRTPGGDMEITQGNEKPLFRITRTVSYDSVFAKRVPTYWEFWGKQGKS